MIYDAETIRRIVELGREITSAYPDGDLLLVVSSGQFHVLADLVRKIERFFNRFHPG